MRLLSALIRPATSSWALAAAASRGSSAAATSRPPPPLIHSSFAEIANHYDAFILDQFGVLHNGVEALPGATECVEFLHGSNKKLIILSNTSAPADGALKKLPKLGFSVHHFVDAVTSGEEASRHVRQTYGKKKESTTTRVIFLTWDATKPNNPRLTAPPQDFLDQCGNVQVTANIQDADLVLLHGCEVWYRGQDTPQESLGSYLDDGSLHVVDELLHQFLEHNLPMVCANPDLVVVTPTAGRAHMPGRIAERYLELGGSCRIFGKPDAEHFEACIEKLGGIDRKRVAHVGDSLHHDILGANAAGIPTVFVTSGIHASQLGTNFGEMPEREALDRLFEQEGAVEPTHVVSAFRM